MPNSHAICASHDAESVLACHIMHHVAEPLGTCIPVLADAIMQLVSEIQTGLVSSRCALPGAWGAPLGAGRRQPPQKAVLRRSKPPPAQLPALRRGNPESGICR